MAFTAFDWNVVIVGRWNPAILTPAGIKTFVFGMAEDEKVHVAVPLDGLSPYVVRHPEQNVAVMLDVNRLLVTLVKQDYEALGYAMKAGIKALESLPRTPFAAAGFNIRFRATEATPEVVAMFDSEIDASLGELGYAISERSLSRSVPYNESRINIIITYKPDSWELLLNFHRDSKDKQALVEWLSMPVRAIETEVNRILGKLNIEIEETHDDDNGQ